MPAPDIITSNQADVDLPPGDARLLLGIVQELSYVRDLAGVVPAVGRAARELTGADGVTFVLREGDLVHYAEENAIGPLWKGRRFPASACISGWAMIHRESVAIENIYADPRIPHDAYRPTFVRSLAMVPVRRDDPVAAIGAYWAAPHAPTLREVCALEALASAVAIALHNAELWETAQRAVRARDEFLAIASHELRTPLTPLVLQLGSLQRALQRGDEPRALLPGVARLGDQVQRIARLVDGLLEISTVAAGELALAPERVDLRAVVRGVVEAHGPELERSGSALALRLDGGLDGLWDPRRVAQIADVLISNAIKYGAGKPIEVEARRAGQEARLAVRDAGIGMSADAQQRIFQRFERAVPVEHFGGFGVGLWLARQLAEAHGGTIEVSSKPGEGSLFTVALPLHGAAQKAAKRPLDQPVPAT
jgi:signal transduction histidine kinase